jgi:hypothetical protein
MDSVLLVLAVQPPTLPTAHDQAAAVVGIDR